MNIAARFVTTTAIQSSLRGSAQLSRQLLPAQSRRSRQRTDHDVGAGASAIHEFAGDGSHPSPDPVAHHRISDRARHDEADPQRLSLVGQTI